VADERGLHPRARRRDVHRRAQTDHGHDVAVEVLLPEQPPRGAHRLARRLQVPPPRRRRRRSRCGRRHRALLLRLWPGRGLSRRVYRDPPLPQRGRGGARAAGIRRRGRIHRRTGAGGFCGRGRAARGGDSDGGVWALPDSGEAAPRSGLRLRVDPPLVPASGPGEAGFIMQETHRELARPAGWLLCFEQVLGLRRWAGSSAVGVRLASPPATDPNCRETKVLFRCENFLDFTTVALSFSFVCDKYCLIID